MSPDLSDTQVLPKIGAQFHRGHGDRRRLYHVRAQVDGDHVVLRTWSCRRGWCYEIVHVTAFDPQWAIYEPVKRKPPARPA